MRFFSYFLSFFLFFFVFLLFFDFLSFFEFVNLGVCVWVCGCGCRRVETRSATVCEGACGRILDYESRSEPLRRVHRPHGDGEPCIRGHVAGRGVRRSLLAFVMLAAAGAHCCWRRCCRDTATRECERSSPKCEGQAKADGSNPARRASHCVQARILADEGVEGRSDQETDAQARRAGTDGRSSSGAVVRQVTLGLEAGRPCLDRQCWGKRVDL